MLRPFLVEQLNKDSLKRNLGNTGERPDSRVCVRTLRESDNAEACQSMKEVLANKGAGPNGSRASGLLRVLARDIKRTGFELRIDNDGKPPLKGKLVGAGNLLTSGLCTSFTMHGANMLFLTFYLDDPPPTP